MPPTLDPNRTISVYLASRYSRRQELQAYAAELQSHGIVVTSRWLTGAHDFPDQRIDDEAKHQLKREFASQDVEDVLAADFLISFTERPRTHSDSRGGRHVEFGLAVAAGKHLMIVGHLENIFHALPNVELYTYWDCCRAALLHYASAASDVAGPPPAACPEPGASPPLAHERPEAPGSPSPGPADVPEFLRSGRFA